MKVRAVKRTASTWPAVSQAMSRLGSSENFEDDFLARFAARKSGAGQGLVHLGTFQGCTLIFKVQPSRLSCTPGNCRGMSIICYVLLLDAFVSPRKMQAAVRKKLKKMRMISAVEGRTFLDVVPTVENPSRSVRVLYLILCIFMY